MKTNTRPTAGFTLVEIMVSMTIVCLVMGLALATFTNGLRVMYKDTQRLVTNSNLRAFTAQVTKETLDATEFIVFPTYQQLDGNVNLATDAAPNTVETNGDFEQAYGDCLVLVTRTATDDNNAKVRDFRIYYRVATATSTQAPIRYYQSTDYGAAGTATDLTTLLNGVNLNANPNIAGSRQLVALARGRGKLGSNPVTYYGIFACESPVASPTNNSVSINVEIINGTSVINMLSSSSFNYTISPRR